MTTETMTKQRLATGMLSKYGMPRQVTKAQEECAALIVAIAKFTGAPSDQTVQQVREEMANVAIMLEQLRILFGREQCDAALENKIAFMAKKHGIK